MRRVRLCHCSSRVERRGARANASCSCLSNLVSRLPSAPLCLRSEFIDLPQAFHRRSFQCGLTSCVKPLNSFVIRMNNLPESEQNNPLAPFFATDSTRREFMKTSSFAAAMTMLGGIPLFAEDPKPAAAAAAGDVAPSKVKVAVIGCNVWGRENLNRSEERRVGK